MVSSRSLEDSVARAKLEAAKAAISEAAKYLDKVLSKMVAVAEANINRMSELGKLSSVAVVG